MKVTVIGCGSIGRRHLRGLTALMDKLGVSEVRGYDTNPDRMKMASQESNSIICFESLADSVKGTDVVFMCAPTSLHIPIYNEIKSLGEFHIFCEKPLSHTIDGCEQMLFDQKLKGKQVAVGYMLHHHRYCRCGLTPDFPQRSTHEAFQYQHRGGLHQIDS